ncbi:hypothetical protein VPHD527_0325 [Vibrio phage D527]
MGSFNTTCAITRTPIQEGALARVFFLEMDAWELNNSYRNGLIGNIMTGCGCYPWDNFKILGLPLLGKYDDYNRYVFQDSATEQLTLDAIRERYLPNKIAEGKTMEDYNSCHDYMEISNISDMHELQDMEHSSALRIKSVHGYPTHVVKMAIHEEVYQMMLEGTMREGWGEDAKTYTFADEVQACLKQHTNVATGWDSLTEEQKDYINAVRDGMYAKADAGEINERTEKPYTREATDMRVERLIESFAEGLDLGLRERTEWFARIDLRQMFRDVGEDEEATDAELLALAEAYIGAKWCARWMQCHNYEFGPAMTCGQDYDTSSHSSRLRKLADIIESKKSEYHYEEAVEVKTIRSVRSELSIAEIKRRFTEWYDESDTEYKDMIAIVDKSVGSLYVVGDESDFDKFSETYGVIRDFEAGDEIYIVE